MALKSRILLLAILPLVLALVLIGWTVATQERRLTEREHDLVDRAYMAARRTELRNYVALASSTIQPLYDQGGDDARDRDEALRLLGALDYGPDGYFFVYDLDGTVLMHSRQPELVGTNLIDLRDPTGRLTIRELIGRARAGGGFVEYLWPRPSTGQVESKLGYVIALERWHWMVGTGLYLDSIHATLTALENEARENIATTLLVIAALAGAAVALIFAGGLALNLSEHRLAESRLRRLARQVQQSQEDERARLARELHDGVSQTLVSTKLLVEAGAESGDASTLGRALERLNDSLVEIRRISHRLRPALLDNLGLPAALQHLAREVAEASGLAVTVKIVGTIPALADEARTALFRIAQESLTNATRHAGANSVALVLIGGADGSAVLRIDDDGRGFDESALQRAPTRGIGLSNMRERMAAVGGELVVRGRPGDGVTVEARLPGTADAGRDGGR